MFCIHDLSCRQTLVRSLAHADTFHLQTRSFVFVRALMALESRLLHMQLCPSSSLILQTFPLQIFAVASESNDDEGSCAHPLQADASLAPMPSLGVVASNEVLVVRVQLSCVLRSHCAANSQHLRPRESGDRMEHTE